MTVTARSEIETEHEALSLAAQLTVWKLCLECTPTVEATAR